MIMIMIGEAAMRDRETESDRTTNDITTTIGDTINRKSVDHSHTMTVNMRWMGPGENDRVPWATFEKLTKLCCVYRQTKAQRSNDR